MRKITVAIPVSQTKLSADSVLIFTICSAEKFDNMIITLLLYCLITCYT